MSETPEQSEQDIPVDDGVWEWWSRLALVLLASMVVTWIVVFARLGELSVYAHGVLLPGIGFLTVPLMFWGLLRTVFRPPAIRRSRTLAFLALVIVGYVGNVPVISPPLSTEDWKAATPYRLPFDGEGYTMAGGDSSDTNYHATTATYRWGYDFGFLDAEQKRFKLDGGSNEDFVCWGKPVLAPIGGKVVAAEDGAEDNVPGDVDPAATLGNFVVIKAGDNEYVYLAHLQKDSVAVKPGDVLNAGAVIGACGNSGRSVEPHIHIHAQTTTNFPFSESLPLRFGCYEVEGKQVRDGMPVGATAWDAGDGQRVTNCASETSSP